MQTPTDLHLTAEIARLKLELARTFNAWEDVRRRAAELEAAILESASDPRKLRRHARRIEARRRAVIIREQSVHARIDAALSASRQKVTSRC